MVASAKPEKIKPPVFTALELSRGWRILRQHLQLHVDVHKRSIRGVAHFTFCAINYQFVNVALNLRRCRVIACRVNGMEAPYRFVSPLDDHELLHAVSQTSFRHRVDDIDHTMHVRHDAVATQSELVIDFPVKISADIIDDLKHVSSAYRASIGKDPADDEDLEPHAAIPVPLSQLPLVTLTVEYETLDPTCGDVYYGNADAPNPVLDPLYMLTESRFGMARFWMPCLDTINWCDRHLFDIDVAVKSSLTVVASGELTETTQFDAPDSCPTKVFKYRMYAPAHASEVILAVGPFIALPDPTLSSRVTHFCLPGLAQELVYTAPPLFAKALAFCREYLGADPPSCSFKQLFVGSLGLTADATRAGAGGIVVHSGDLLHTQRCIDEGLVAREAIMNGLVMSYFGRFLRPRIAEDDWLISGLASHVAALGLQSILGQNWYRFRVADLMKQLCEEESCDLSDTKTSRIPDRAAEAVRRRSQIIVYMIERRIGSDVLKRALRDMVAEGRSAIIAAVKGICQVLSKPMLRENGTGASVVIQHEMQCRELTDFSGGQSAPTTTGVVTTGFEDGIQGVGVGPFLKRIRAIVGTDVRSMVRLWAASRGVPRLRVGYQYNARKHSIEFAVKQEGVVKGEQHDGRPGLPFTGSVNIRVMEDDGIYNHSIEISDALFSTELQCHSRRTKTSKPAAGGDKDTNDNARTCPVLWIRFDPDKDWCLDCTFMQPEDSWISLLKSERDAMGQFEACEGLANFDDETSAKALASIAADDMVYWRVRVEAARSLASNERGLQKLLKYFRSSYVDGDEAGTGLLRPCNFGDVANYFVKRGIVCAIADARTKGSSSLRAGGSIPLAATKFLSFLLSGHDNTGNQFDDDHYVVDLLESAARAAVCCIGDESHAIAGEDGTSSTDSIIQQLERFRSIDGMIPRRTDLVKSAISSSLARIQIASMMYNDRIGNGVISTTILGGRFEHNASLTGHIFELCGRHRSFRSRLQAAADLIELYGGDLDVFVWILARIDTVSSGESIIKVENSEVDSLSNSEFGYYEPPTFRYKLMDALLEAASVPGWGKAASPMVLALRRHTSRAMQVCSRLLRLMTGEADPRIRSSASRFVRAVWGVGVPVCLLSRSEYVDEKHWARTGKHRTPASIVPLKSNMGIFQPQVIAIADPRPAKPTKSAKGQKRKAETTARSGPRLVSEPLNKTPKLSRPTEKHEQKPAKLSSEVLHPPENRGKSSSKAQRASKSIPKVHSAKSDSGPLPILRSSPLSVPSEKANCGANFPWEPLDDEDIRFLKRVWQENQVSDGVENDLDGRSADKKANHVGERVDALLTLSKPIDGSSGQKGEVAPSSQNEADFSKNGLDVEHRKKKKKKKRKRHLDDEDEHKRRKKKKKKREVDEYGSYPPSNRESHSNFEGPSAETRKIGKFTIRREGSVAHVAKSE